MIEAISGVSAVAVVSGASLLGLKMWLAFKARDLSNAPVAALQKRMDDLESRILSGAFKR